MEIKDSGVTREFDTGAHRDNAEGKGRCDLLPGYIVAESAEKIGIDSIYMEDYICHDDTNEFICGLVRDAAKTALSSLKSANSFRDCIDKVIVSTAVAEGMRVNDETNDCDIREDYKNDDVDAVAAKMYWYGIMQVSKHYEEGGRKYGDNNWKKGMNTHVYYDSMVRHLLKASAGMDDEPHIRAACWNALCLLWTIDNMPTLNDLIFEGTYC